MLDSERVIIEEFSDDVSMVAREVIELREKLNDSESEQDDLNDKIEELNEKIEELEEKLSNVE